MKYSLFNWIFVMRAFFSMALACAAGAAVAQDVVGTAIVGGKKVQILSDFTWRFEKRQVEACYFIDPALEFCGKEAGWSRLGGQPPQITAAFMRDGRYYAFFIMEQVGSNDGVGLDFISEAIIANTANSMGISPSELPIFSSDDVEFYGKDARRIVYQVKLNGASLVFVNTIWVDSDVTGQVFTYTFGDKLKDSDWKLHDQVAHSLTFAK